MQGPRLTVSIKHSAHADAAHIEDCGHPSHAVGRVSSPRFIGRRGELMALDAALPRTREGPVEAPDSHTTMRSPRF
jgi:hypothetical protein